MQTPLRTALVALLWIVGAEAQNEPKVQRTSRNPRLLTGATPDGQKRDPREDKGGDEELVDPNAVRGGLNRYADLRGSVRPRRLAPGQTGTATFYVAMRPLYAGLSDGRFEVEVASSQGSLEFGPATVSEPTSESSDPQLSGMVVYDDLIRIEVPVTVLASAQPGSHTGAALVRIPIHERRSGQQAGVFQGAIRVQIAIGDPLPVIGALGEDGGPGPVSGGAPNATEASDPASSGPLASTPSGGAASRTDGVRASPVSSGDPRDRPATLTVPSAPSSSGGMESLLLAGAAVAALGAILALFLKRK